MRKYSEEEQADIIRRYHQIRKTKEIDDSYTGLTDDEAMCVILPSVGFKEMDALFILGRARGTLPDFEIDEEGRNKSVQY